MDRREQVLVLAFPHDQRPLASLLQLDKYNPPTLTLSLIDQPRP
ncbi:MAG TPA: hypothetical protein VEX68_14635 [Bryobacteraceae bacterium]|nr:hypothetical protein [Bryobacteraceae bacterium]